MSTQRRGMPFSSSDRLRYLLAMGSALLVAACAAPPGPAPSAPPASAARNAQVAQQLAAHHWRLASATDAGGRPLAALAPPVASTVEFGFPDGRIEIRGGCNLRGAPYQIAPDGRLLVGRVVTTMMACEPPLMQVDATLSALLATPLRIEVADGVNPGLRLTAESGATLAFAGRPTPEARYGAPTIAFLEVAPRRVACSHPMIPNARCLQVRDIRYDQQGLKVGPPGEWRLLYEDIEGFQPTEGVRNVVRVKRFTRSPVPADASATLYVLDLVVESETVPR